MVVAGTGSGGGRYWWWWWWQVLGMVAGTGGGVLGLQTTRIDLRLLKPRINKK